MMKKKNKEEWIETIGNKVHINPTVSKINLKVNTEIISAYKKRFRDMLSIKLHFKSKKHRQIESKVMD